MAIAKGVLAVMLAALILVSGCITQPQQKGHLVGKVSIGPICPVERVGVPCEPSPEQYAARKVMVYSLGGLVKVGEATPDAKGHYSIALDPGSYYVDVVHSGIGGVQGVPANVTIESGKNTTLDISIDTGIR